MESNKFERVIFMLLRVLGTISIIGGYLGEEILYKYNTIRIGHIVYISPILLVEMIVTITLYNIFIRILERHITIKKK